MSLTLFEGSEAIAEAAIAAGLRFYAGYPMSPATELLEHLARKLPASGGTCINAATEIEGVNMAMGAAAAGFRAATGSCGQGLALMQEAIAESALNETPLVVFNMARNQQDYFQATRGGGWGDYRTIALAPKDLPEAVELTQLAFHLADLYRVPVIVLGDNLLARTQVSVDVGRRDFGPLPPKDWQLDGTSGGSGKSRQIWTWGAGKHNTPGPGPSVHWARIAEKFDRIAETEMRWEEGFVEDAETVVVAFGTGGKFVEHVVHDLRGQGHRIGFFRPVTLWPFPGEALERATANARRVLVFELNAGQMIDDVRLNVRDRRIVRPIGGVSFDSSGLNLGPLMDATVIRQRILDTLEGATL
ncbi:thiamine pyrophosphate-binding protein [Azospirillum soli]|uniref:thiamine pyrophosphate-binding protein n=1 Tax=Azospirillum soli TaxID=1304799 RepID=UPI001AE77509|nr:thiamine pyrophosphate-binding protein [Azospirillum soli]MBP2316601.1 2-oxoglutarate ferredoxin oxidoreductase subunit alpha [Azospirillum soli]